MQMNFPGSAMGAWSRALEAGTVTHSVMEATASCEAAPPSRKPRVLCGTSVAAISWARTTPRRARGWARLAWRSAMRSPWSAPRRGEWPLTGKRTRLMGDGPPPEEMGQFKLLRNFPAGGGLVILG